MIVIVWFRQDLRLADNSALYYACQHATHIIPLFIDDPTPLTTTQLGSASRVWLHHSLQALQDQLKKLGSELILRQGQALPILQELIAQTGATHLVWNRLYDPASIARDKQIKTSLQALCEVRSFNSSLIKEPWEVLKADGTPYQVFSPFWKALLKQGFNSLPLAAPQDLPSLPKILSSLTLDQLQLLPNIRWDTALIQHWQVGEIAAQTKLQHFLINHAARYAIERDYPALATSGLSPHLHSGEIGPRQLVYQALRYCDENPSTETDVNFFLRELGWREFAYYLLYHFPHTVDKPLDERFARFPWAEHYDELLVRWQQGQTGIPIIDAGMRQLWQSGWMHNRVRMLVASLLTKNLLIPWQIGEQWFRDTLVDADLANNVLGWQWTAGCGADAAPYFRLFNPILQSQKFDPDGTYIRQWVPELKHRSKQTIHLPRSTLEQLGSYPFPIIDLQISREQALARFEQIKQRS